MVKDIELFDNKIIILYILENAKFALTIDDIAKFCIDFEDISYFDICDYLTVLLKEKLIEETYETNILAYKITEEGQSTLKELLELIPGISIFNLKKLVQKEIVNLKKSYTINTQTVPLSLDTYEVSCYIKDRTDELINIKLLAGDKKQARIIVDNWQNNAEDIYQEVLQLMTKKNNE